MDVAPNSIATSMDTVPIQANTVVLCSLTRLHTLLLNCVPPTRPRSPVAPLDGPGN